MNMMNSANMEVPTAAELRKLRVVDLRKKLQSLELTQQGERERVATACGARLRLSRERQRKPRVVTTSRVHSQSVNVRLWVVI